MREVEPGTKVIIKKASCCDIESCAQEYFAERKGGCKGHEGRVSDFPCFNDVYFIDLNPSGGCSFDRKHFTIKKIVKKGKRK
jgi:hypothetical protein